MIIRFLRRLMEGAGRRRVTSFRELGEFLARRAVFAAQKAVTDYCEVKAGSHRDQLFADPDFLAELDRCRRETFTAVLADAIIVVEGMLRPHLASQETRAAAHGKLVELYGRLLESDCRPRHRPDGWGDLIPSFAARLGEAESVPPRRPQDVAAFSCRRAMETLPVHPAVRRADREAIEGGMTFQFMALYEAMLAEVDPTAIAAELESALSENHAAPA